MPSPRFPVRAVQSINVTISSQRSSGQTIWASTMLADDEFRMVASNKETSAVHSVFHAPRKGDSGDAGVVQIAHDIGGAFRAYISHDHFHDSPFSSSKTIIMKSPLLQSVPNKPAQIINFERELRRLGRCCRLRWNPDDPSVVCSPSSSR